jgi:threonyl-tRNA synthetase
MLAKGRGNLPRKAVFSMSEMIRVTLPDGSVREVARGTTAARSPPRSDPGLAKAALAARVDGELRDLGRPLEKDSTSRW